MAKYELPIYGENDEIVKTYQTDLVRYGILEDALAIQENLNTMKPREQINQINSIIQRVFKGLTIEELHDADLGDVRNLFNQIVSISDKATTNKTVNQKN